MLVWTQKVWMLRLGSVLAFLMEIHPFNHLSEGISCCLNVFNFYIRFEGGGHQIKKNSELYKIFNLPRSGYLIFPEGLLRDFKMEIPYSAREIKPNVI